MTAVRNVVALTAAVALCCAMSADAESTAVTVRPVGTANDMDQLMDTIDGLFEAADAYQLAPGVRVKRCTDVPRSIDQWASEADVDAADRRDDPEKYLLDRIARYAGTHVLDVNFSEVFRHAGRSVAGLIQLRKWTFSFVYVSFFGPPNRIVFGFKSVCFVLFGSLRILPSSSRTTGVRVFRENCSTANFGR